MNDETIVAVFDTAEHATAAVRDLEAAGVPASAITQHAGVTQGSTTTAGLAAPLTTHPQPDKGFWANLFGGDPEYDHDTTVYDRSMQGGSTVVTVRASASHLDLAVTVLESHNPIDIDERATSYGLGASGAASGTSAAVTGLSGTRSDVAATGAGVVSREPGTLSLSEETLAVGKRAVNRGTTRVRRYVVETPVEETVSLRDEHVSVERRPVTDGRAVGSDSFGDKVIEMTETAEEAVVAKQARVREEVVIHKDATDRTETVRDTVRREDVEITKDPVVGGVGTTQTGTARAGLQEPGQPETFAPAKPAI